MGLLLRWAGLRITWSEKKDGLLLFGKDLDNRDVREGVLFLPRPGVHKEDLPELNPQQFST
jgi:hypothetical protein